jgi:hypothetical protein
MEGSIGKCVIVRHVRHGTACGYFTRFAPWKVLGMPTPAKLISLKWAAFAAVVRGWA